MKLTDQQILTIFRELNLAGTEHGGFLHHYAVAILKASSADFLIMRPVSLVLIGKYSLERFLGTGMAVHNFPGPRRSA